MTLSNLFSRSRANFRVHNIPDCAKGRKGSYFRIGMPVCFVISPRIKAKTLGEKSLNSRCNLDKGGFDCVHRSKITVLFPNFPFRLCSPRISTKRTRHPRSRSFLIIPNTSWNLNRRGEITIIKLHCGNFCVKNLNGTSWWTLRTSSSWGNWLHISGGNNIEIFESWIIVVVDWINSLYSFLFYIKYENLRKYCAWSTNFQYFVSSIAINRENKFFWTKYSVLEYFYITLISMDTDCNHFDAVIRSLWVST